MVEPYKTQSLSELADNIFLLILGFREKADSFDFTALSQGVSKLFEEFDHKARALKFDSEDINDSKYALAAFADEAILRSQWAGREQWADNPLQLQMFETYLAGEGFFEKLETLRTRGEPAVDVLEIYYLCLALGFEGKYGIEGTERLSSLAKLLHDELIRYRPTDLKNFSPHWKVVDGPKRESNKLPRWLIYSCAAVIILCLLFYIGFFIRIRSAAGDLKNGPVAAIFMQAEYSDRLILC